MDDPIFDPWAIAEPGEERVDRRRAPTPDAPESAEGREGPDDGRTSRWRSAHSPEAPPRRRPVARPLPPMPGPVSPSTLEGARQISQQAAPPVRPPSARNRTLGVIRERVLPRFEALALRLDLGGHATALDERLDGPLAALRCRVSPRRGPFDAPPESVAPGSVLEVAVGDEDPRVIVGQIWLDPMAEAPTDERFFRVENPIDQGLDLETWTDDLLVEFIACSLRRAPEGEK